MYTFPAAYKSEKTYISEHIALQLAGPVYQSVKCYSNLITLILHTADPNLAFMQVVNTARMAVQTELASFLRLALFGCLFTGSLAGSSLPTAWRIGIATNYGGAQDRMVSQSENSPALHASMLATNMLP